MSARAWSRKPLLWLIAAALPWIPGTWAAEAADWMSGLPDATPLTELSIPGTHDSGALFEPLPGTAKCQDLPLAEQLALGVRFLDIRCRHAGDAFVIHHGMVPQNLAFDDVLATVNAFLAQHPRETVILSIQEEWQPEKNTRSFEQTFDRYVARAPDNWRLDSAIPTLGAARGKIVLFRRFAATHLPKGIDASRWPGNTTFSSGILRVQDAFKVESTDAKWRKIEALFAEANPGKPGILYVNFTSGVRTGALGIPDISSVARDINERLEQWLDSHRARGIVVMDFANAGHCARILSGNKSAAQSLLRRD